MKILLLLLVCLARGAFAQKVNINAQNSNSKRTFDYWTPERIAKAIPRDLVIDPVTGEGYVKQQQQGERTLLSVPDAATSTGNHNRLRELQPDRSDPVFTALFPSGETVIIDGSITFTGSIADDSDLESASLVIEGGGATRTVAIVPLQVGSFSVDVPDFPTDFDYDYLWYVTAKDKGFKGGNTGISDILSFATTGSGTPPPPPTDLTVSDGAWTVPGGVKAASGRLLFTMPGGNFVCSGTVVVDGTSGRSIIVTAAHCVYDDVNKVFSSYALFIPNQDGGSGSGTDTDCSNDPIGCWSAGYGVVDKEWTLRTFPDNIPWDYAYYVVDDVGAHQQGLSLMTDDALDTAVITPIPIDFSWDGSNPYTHAIGYSGDKDPDLRYCAENVNQNVGPANWWLGSCAMSGGSSGGPWMEPIDADGMGSIVSVNSWGYTNSDGMAGPLLQGNSAKCVFSKAKEAELADDADRGVIVNYENENCEIYTPPPCVPAGTSCTESGQCCSNKCTGRFGNKTCK
jgi:hypothetical protein